MIDEVCDTYGIPRDRVLSDTRGTVREAWARQVLYWLMYQRTRNYTSIGQVLGRDHTVVRDGVLKVEGVLEAGGADARTVRELKERIDAGTVAGDEAQAGLDPDTSQ